MAQIRRQDRRHDRLHTCWEAGEDSNRMRRMDDQETSFPEKIYSALLGGYSMCTVRVYSAALMNQILEALKGAPHRGKHPVPDFMIRDIAWFLDNARASKGLFLLRPPPLSE